MTRQLYQDMVSLFFLLINIKETSIVSQLFIFKLNFINKTEMYVTSYVKHKGALIRLTCDQASVPFFVAAGRYY